MPMPRLVPRGGANVAGEVLPGGVSPPFCSCHSGLTLFQTECTVSTRSIHHNARFWGKDVEEFKPERWMGEDAAELEKGLATFSYGHRSCVGRK